MTGANGFLKKNECTVVWAAFRDRNFEVGLPEAMSVPSKYNNFSHTQVKSTISLFFFSYFQLFPLCMPLICHLSPSGPHRNLIGTSPSDERIIKQSSPRVEQLFFDIIIQPCRHSRFAILWHTLMFACLTQCGTMFLCPCFALHRVTQDCTCLF